MTKREAQLPPAYRVYGGRRIVAVREVETVLAGRKRARHARPTQNATCVEAFACFERALRASRGSVK